MKSEKSAAPGSLERSGSATPWEAGWVDAHEESGRLSNNPFCPGTLTWLDWKRGWEAGRFNCCKPNVPVSEDADP